MREKANLRKAFSLVEILVVIAIIGLLAGVVTASVNASREKARIAAAIQFDANLYHTLGDELAGYWGFEEGAGQVVKDLSGNGNDGTLGASAAASTDDPTWSTNCYRKSSGCLSFDGSNDYVNVGTSFDVSIPFSISVWVNPTDYDSDRHIFGKRDQWSVGNSRFDFQLSPSSGKVTLLQPSPGKRLVFNYSPPIKTWTHLVLNVSTNGTEIYADGTFKEKLGVFILDTKVNARTRIGLAGDGQDPFKGGIDDLRIYRKALGQAQVEKLYAEGREKHKMAAN